TWPRPAGSVRQATLHRRSLRALSPSRVRLLCGTAAVLGIALGVFVLTADETGRAVPAMITAEGALAGRLGGASGPYPGSRYAGPIAVGLIVVLVATAWVLHRVAHRPAVAGATPEDDQLLRRTGARRILGGVQLCVGATSAAVLLVAAVSLTNAGWTLAAWTAGVVGLLCGLTSVIAAGTALPAPQPTTTTVAAWGCTSPSTSPPGYRRTSRSGARSPLSSPPAHSPPATACRRCAISPPTSVW